MLPWSVSRSKPIDVTQSLSLLVHWTDSLWYRGDKEFPRAFVVRKNPSVSAEELHTFIKGRFARYKWLTGGIFFIERIPRTASGKVIRRELPNPKESRL
jgi:acyl-CoA synthetase (AMP-forming)/AMP-acid ligase II